MQDMKSSNGYNSSSTTKSEIVRKIVAKHPATPSKRLAKIIKEKYPDLFSTVEDARNVVRYVRGSNGVESRKRVHLLEKLLKTDLDYDYLAPQPYNAECGKWLILADIHFPFHNERVLDIALETGKKNKITGIILNGDIVDCFMLSNFCRRPDVITFKEERRIATLFLMHLRKRFKDARIIWKDGNHDNRVLTYICQNAPAIWDEEWFNWQSMLGLDALDIDYVKSNQWITLGKLTLLHGHEFGDCGRFGSASSVNPARGLFLKTKQCSVCAHHHQSSQHNETTVDGTLITTWSLGCLSSLHPMYRPITKWNWGFGICEVDKRGMFKFKNYRVLGNYELVD